jgi:hypothetical protein
MKKIERLHSICCNGLLSILAWLWPWKSANAFAYYTQKSRTVLERDGENYSAMPKSQSIYFTIKYLQKSVTLIKKLFANKYKYKKNLIGLKQYFLKIFQKIMPVLIHKQRTYHQTFPKDYWNKYEHIFKQ